VKTDNPDLLYERFLSNLCSGSANPDTCLDICVAL